MDDGSTVRRRNTAIEQVKEQVASRAKRTARALQQLDAYPKVNEDYALTSNTGGVVTIVCAVICLILFISEVSWHRTTSTTSTLSVDNQPLISEDGGTEKMKIYLDITFPKVACSLISLDTTDVSGERHMDIHDGHILKRRLDKHGDPVDTHVKEKVNKFKDLNDTDSEEEEEEEEEKTNLPAMPLGGPLGMLGLFGGRGNMMNLFASQFPEGIETAFKNEKQEGCEVMGYLEVNRVAGQFHISPGKSLQLGGMTIQLAVQSANLNMTHHIKRLAFGESFPGAVNPLDETLRQLQHGAVHQYFLKVVPTTFLPVNGGAMSTNQFSVTESTKLAQDGQMSGGKPAGIYFSYELSPLRVNYKETRSTFTEFLTSVCAIIGGTFTISGILHSIGTKCSVAIKKMQSPS